MGISDRKMRKLDVLVGCEESGTVRNAFTREGHNAMSCDLLPTRLPGPHYEGDIFDVIDYPWEVGIFHPPCTNTCVSGARHFEAKRLDGRQQAGVSFFMSLWRRSAHIKGVAFEQPVSIISRLFRKPDQIIQPWMFGEFETKATCLWLRDLPPLIPTYRSIAECRDALGLAADAMPLDRVHKMAPGPDRARERSKTYQGIATAMANQWGGC